MGDNFRENIVLSIKLFDALISPILLYGSEIWVVDCNDQIEKDPSELVQIKFLKWLLGVNKYCSNNACRAETGRFPMKIEAQYRNFKFWLTLTKHPKHKLSLVVYNDNEVENEEGIMEPKNQTRIRPNRDGIPLDKST